MSNRLISQELAMENIENKILHLTAVMPEMLEQLDSLETRESTGQELMRLFHSLKGMAGYADLNHMRDFAHQVEDVLCAIYPHSTPIREQVTQWLQRVHQHIVSWKHQLEDDDYDLLPFIDNSLKTAVYSLESLQETMQQCLLVIVEGDNPNLSLFRHLETLMQKVMVASSFQDALHYVKKNGDDKTVLLCDATKSNKAVLKVIEQIQAKTSRLPIVVIENIRLPEKHRIAYLASKSIDFFIEHPAESSTIQNSLELVVGNYFMEKRIKIEKNDDILKQVDTLAPLPASVQELNRFRTDPSVTLKEISDVITKDAALSTKLLKIISSPIMGLSHNVTSTHQAITLLGKDRVLAIAMQDSMDKALPIKLSAYGIDERQFYDISYLRMNLILYWYMKVNLSKVGLLTTAALIGNLGQVIISTILAQEGESSSFRKVVEEKGARKAELEVLQTTAESVTVDILTHWQIDSEITNVIKYADNPASAPEGIRNEAFALHVAYSTIPSTSLEINPRTVESMASDISLKELNSSAYRKAIEKIRP